jgi:glucose/arabinose dehydrogenase
MPQARILIIGTPVRLKIAISFVLASSALSQAPPPGSGPLNIPSRVRVIEGDTFETYIAGKQAGIGLIGITVPMGNTACGQLANKVIQSALSLGAVSGLHLDEDLSYSFDKRQRRMYYATTPDNGNSLPLLLVLAGVAHPDGTGKDAAQLQQADAVAAAAHVGCLNNGPTILPKAAEALAEAPAAQIQPRSSLLPNFTQELVAGGFNSPTGIAFLPDGRVLVAEKHGIVKGIKNGSVLPAPFIDISTEVNDYWDHGLLGIAADPNFATNNFVYLLYTYEDNPAQFNGSKTARLTRVTANGDTASPFTETVLLGTVTGSSCNLFAPGSDCLVSDGVTHSIGSVRFAPDGTMFITIGDGANFNTVDNNAYRAQDLNWLAGKLLHITTTGQGIPTNPFFNGDVNANRSKVHALGFRNPFRMQLRPSTSTPYLGDVGWDTWEEINVGKSGANYGWPCYEGNFQQAGYAPAAVCQSLYALGASAVTSGIVVWNHNGASAAAIGGSFYTGTLYPPQYQGAYFFGDYGQNVIRYATVDASNNLVGGPTDFVTAADGPVDIEMAPDGNLYYVAIVTGELRRIRYTAGNTPPTAVASATPTAGLAPLAVTFSSTGSSDPDGDVLTYSWDFGDASAVSAATNPSHTYTANGSYTARLTVNDGHGNTSSATVAITVGNRPPVPVITSPGSSLLWKVGDVITFAGSATDPEDGTEPATRLSWQVILHHCPGGVCHIHPFLTATGATGTFTAPDHGDSCYFEIILTATDSGGLQASTSVVINPQTAQFTIATSPAGLQVVNGGIAETGPTTSTTILGATHTIFAPSPQSSLGVTYTFAGWSDGGAQQHNVTAASNSSFTATFTGSFSPIRVNCGGGSYTDPQGQTWAADTGFLSGTAFSVGSAISNTNSPTLYQSERYDSGTLQYSFNVPNGPYSVNLKFAEIFFTQSGQRKFNIIINGQTVAANFDVFAAAGGPNRAVDNSYPVTVSGGQIAIQLVSVVSAAKISAIEIVTNSGISVALSPGNATVAQSQTQQFTAAVTGSANQAVTWSLFPVFGSISSTGLYTAPSLVSTVQNITVTATSAADSTKSASVTFTVTPPGGFVPIRVNAGGPTYTDTAGNIWSADTGASSGTGFQSNAVIGGTADPTLYQSEHYDVGTFQYQFPAPNGTYTVTLKFDEIFYTSAGQRVFDIVINGATVLPHFDIFAQAGAATAIDKTFTVAVTNNVTTIQFAAVTSNPKVNAFSIVASTGAVVAVAVAPKTVSLSASQTQQFSATVTGTSNQAVTWSISPNTGTISSAGLYTAPSAIASVTTVTVKATSVADATRFDTAAVTLNPPAAGFTPIRVNAGGPAYTDSAGNAWSADTGFSAGQTFATNTPITGTSDPTLYQSERWNGTTFQYQFTVPAGSYAVKLKYAEIFYTAANQRKFNVNINGTAVQTNFDIFAQAGAANKAFDQTFTVSSSGTITIQFVPVVSNPKISAIEILQATGIAVSVSPGSATLAASQTQQFTATVTGTTTTGVTWSLAPALGTITTGGLYTAPSSIAATQTVTVTATSTADVTKSSSATVTLSSPFTAVPIRVNAGGSGLTDSAGQVWSADTGFSGGSTYSVGTAITGTATPALYQSERWSSGPLTYQFNVAAATHTVTLKFAEIFYTGAGQRIFNVSINGQSVLSNFDIFSQAAGANKALDKPFTVVHPGGALTILLTPITSNPKISAIEIK